MAHTLMHANKKTETNNYKKNSEQNSLAQKLKYKCHCSDIYGIYTVIQYQIIYL